MVQSLFTGSRIYEDIKRLEAKRQELLDGLNQLEDAGMEDTAAYTAVKDSYDKVVQDKRKAENVKYVIHEMKGDTF